MNDNKRKRPLCTIPTKKLPDWIETRTTFERDTSTGVRHKVTHFPDGSTRYDFGGPGGSAKYDKDGNEC